MKTPAMILIFVAALVLIAAAGTIAWLKSTPLPIVNNMIPGEVTVEVEETFDGVEKTDVSIVNTGNIKAFIRVALVIYMTDENGNIVGRQITREDLDITWPEDFEQNWFLGADGFFYCRECIEPLENTPVLIERCVLPVGEYEYTPVLHIIAEGIQSAPETAVTEAWPAVIVQNGSLAPA